MQWGPCGHSERIWSTVWMGWPHGLSPVEVRFLLSRVPSVFPTLARALLRDTQSFLCRLVPVGSCSSRGLVASFG